MLSLGCCESTNMASKVTGRPVTVLWVLLVSGAFFLAGGERVKNKIYDEIQGDMPCFKRFNGTHEIGCTSKFFGNTGVLHVIREKADFDWVYEHGPHQPYILAITPLFLTEAVLERARDSGKVSGVVVIVPEDFDAETQLLDGFSGETECPDRYLGLYNESSNPDYAGYCKKKPWNPNGTSLLYTSWEFPIFLITNQTSVENIQNCFEKFNNPVNGMPRDWPLCSMELKSNMYGTTNSEVCIRRASIGPISTDNFCDPLFDYNIWGTLKPMNISDEVPEKSVIVVAARMDAATMFDNISPGANSAVSGIVTLMSAATAIFKHKEEIINASNKNVLFILFQGETWGYIGSSRVVWDMERGQFPYEIKEDVKDQVGQINLTHIDYFIELEQVGQAMESKQLFLHTDPISNANSEVKKETDNLLEVLTDASELIDDLSFVRVKEDVPLPPSSIQSFLKRVNISGVVITDHEGEFKNPYYESFLDNYRNVRYQADNETSDTDNYHKHITNVASVLATTIYRLATNTSKKITADPELTNELLFCYMKNMTCNLVQKYGGETAKYLEPKPVKLYVSVENGERERSFVTMYIMAGLLGDEVERNQSDCQLESRYNMNQLYYFSNLRNGTCVQTTVRMTDAMSPAFLIEDYDWKSGEYSTWTESGWKLTKVMIFLRPSVLEEVALVCGGVVSLVLSVIVVHFMNSRADLLFGLSTPPAAC
ncbi:nicastrin-like [Penaeus japonicus]|uniref:nicastrin-like n=1 Tax=Penaeus japonicus TaxID=27405 RepID=UPI001C712FE6|nr:nicastrin-like [Penaeus japonicus]